MDRGHGADEEAEAVPGQHQASRTIRRRRHSSRGRTLRPAGTSAFVLVASVPSTCTREGLGLDAARGIPDIQSRAALPNVSVGIPASSRRDFEAEATFAAESGLGSSGFSCVRGHRDVSSSHRRKQPSSHATVPAAASSGASRVRPAPRLRGGSVSELTPETVAAV
jgi:hypothetical protein